MVEGRNLGQQYLEQEVRNKSTEVLNTEVWGTMETLHMPISQVEFEYVERDLIEPPEAKALRARLLIDAYNERIEALKKQNPSAEYEVRVDDEREGATGRPALFQKGNERPIGWDGNTITLAQKGARHENGKLIVPVYQIDYSEWTACNNEEYLKIFKDKGLPLPYAGIGVSILMETSDGLYPITQRGQETPVYPGRTYTFGGGPRSGQTFEEAIIEEISEESGLVEGQHFDRTKITALAMVSDSKYADDPDKKRSLYASRPELVLTVQAKTSFREIEKVRHDKVNRGGKEADVWGMIGISTYEPSLAQYIISRGQEMCPPLEAGLAHALNYKVMNSQGPERALQVSTLLVDQLKKSERPPFKPTIVRAQ